MPSEGKERWQILCEQVAVEQDPDKFLRLIRELNELLESREKQLMHLGEARAEQKKDDRTA
jgi:hypothetical protein